MSDIPTDANFWFKIWAPIGAVLMAAISLFGISSGRIGKVEESVSEDHKEFVGKPDCKEDRDGLKEYVKEIKQDIHWRIDRMEKNIIKAIKGE